VETEKYAPSMGVLFMKVASHGTCHYKIKHLKQRNKERISEYHKYTVK